MTTISDFEKALIIWGIESRMTSLKIYMDYNIFSIMSKVIEMFMSSIR